MEYLKLKISPLRRGYSEEVELFNLADAWKNSTLGLGW